jgi:hypothetical protein
MFCTVVSYQSCLLPLLNHGPCEAINWLDLQASGIVFSSPFSSPVKSCLGYRPTGHGPFAGINWLDLQAPGIVLSSPFSSLVLSCLVLPCLPPLLALIQVNSTDWICKLQVLCCPAHVTVLSIPVMCVLSCLLPVLSHGPCEAINWLDLQASDIVLSSPFSCPVLSCPVLSSHVLSTSPIGHGPCEAINWLDLWALGIIMSSPSSCPVLSCPLLSCLVFCLEPWPM